MTRAWMRTSGFIGREEGQAMALFAGLAVLMIAAVGLVIDAGRVVGTRTQLQKAADAAALAAAQDLPDRTSATAVANQYVATNAPSGVTAAVQVTSKNYPNDTVGVSVTGRVNYTFLRVFGMSGTSVSAKATSRRSVFMGGWSKNLVPWGLVTGTNPNSALLQNECYLGSDAFGLPVFKTHTHCNIKYGSGYAGQSLPGEILWLESHLQKAPERSSYTTSIPGQEFSLWLTRAEGREQAYLLGQAFWLIEPQFHENISMDDIPSVPLGITRLCSEIIIY